MSGRSFPTSWPVSMFRQIMRSGTFEERFVAGQRLPERRHVYASVQSLARLDLARDLSSNRFDITIAEDFHHDSKETETYANLSRHVHQGLLAVSRRKPKSSLPPGR